MEGIVRSTKTLLKNIDAKISNDLGAAAAVIDNESQNDKIQTRNLPSSNSILGLVDKNKVSKLIDATTMTDVAITKVCLKPPAIFDKKLDAKIPPAVPKLTEELSLEDELALLSQEQLQERMSLLATDQEKLDLFDKYQAAKKNIKLVQTQANLNKLKTKVRMAGKIVTAF